MLFRWHLELVSIVMGGEENPSGQGSTKVLKEEIFKGTLDHNYKLECEKSPSFFSAVFRKNYSLQLKNLGSLFCTVIFSCVFITSIGMLYLHMQKENIAPGGGPVRKCPNTAPGLSLVDNVNLNWILYASDEDTDLGGLSLMSADETPDLYTGALLWNTDDGEGAGNKGDTLRDTSVPASYFNFRSNPPAYDEYYVLSYESTPDYVPNEAFDLNAEDYYAEDIPRSLTEADMFLLSCQMDIDDANHLSATDDTIVVNVNSANMTVNIPDMVVAYTELDYDPSNGRLAHSRWDADNALLFLTTAPRTVVDDFCISVLKESNSPYAQYVATEGIKRGKRPNHAALAICHSLVEILQTRGATLADNMLNQVVCLFASIVKSEWFSKREFRQIVRSVINLAENKASPPDWESIAYALRIILPFVTEFINPSKGMSPLLNRTIASTFRPTFCPLILGHCIRIMSTLRTTTPTPAMTLPILSLCIKCINASLRTPPASAIADAAISLRARFGAVLDVPANWVPVLFPADAPDSILSMLYDASVHEATTNEAIRLIGQLAAIDPNSLPPSGERCAST
ncbi:hypothetical protein KIPB_007966, partial [Kipferlia bialata]|eukprot:g7966.t1